MAWCIRRGLLAWFVVLLLITESLPLLTATAQPASPAASPVVGTPVASASPSADPAATLPPGVTAAEQALADKWVPIAMLRTQPHDCSSEGEPYIPIAVDITLNNPDVMLRQRIAGSNAADDPIIMYGPSAADLVGLDSTYYLDLPGDSLNPGCVYEQWSRERIAELGLEPSVYAHIATEPGRPGKLAIQYWFYYAFDSYNNSHESDWEMIQLTFDADTAEEALLQEQPSLVSFAQHSGGENAFWGDNNIVLADDRIVTFPAQGSHASYYGSAIWLAWGEHGSGFGCDQSQPDLTEVHLQAIVIPQHVDIGGDFAWTIFQGRWGEYHPWQFNAPVSPNLTRKWREPVSWTDNLRSVSYAVPHEETFGRGPGEFFCALSSFGGDLAKRVQVSPQIIAGGFLAVMVGLFFVSFLTWRFLKRAIGLYVRHWRVFVLTSGTVLLAGALSALIRRVTLFSVVNDWVQLDPETEAGLTGFVARGGVGITLYYLLLLLSAPWIIALTGSILAGQPISLPQAIATTWRKIPRIAGALVLNSLLVFLMFLSVILIPLGIYRQVQWFYSIHAVVLENATVRTARHVSRNSIKGDWLRTFGMAMVASIVSGVPGPLIGMGLVLTNRVSLEIAGYVSSAIFAIVYPVTIIASTLYYRWRQETQAERIAAGLTATEGEAMRQRLRLRFRADPTTDRPPTSAEVQPG